MSGTYTGALMPVLAAIECLKMMEEPGFYERVNGKAQKLYTGINRLFKTYSIPGHVRGVGARFATFFGIEDEETDFDFRKIVAEFDAPTYRKFVKKALENGLYFHIEGWSTGGISLPTHCGITSSHTEDDIVITLEKMERIFEEISKERT